MHIYAVGDLPARDVCRAGCWCTLVCRLVVVVARNRVARQPKPMESSQQDIRSTTEASRALLEVIGELWPLRPHGGATPRADVTAR